MARKVMDTGVRPRGSLQSRFKVVSELGWDMADPGAGAGVEQRAFVT